MEKNIFEQNEELDVVYQTSDGVNFYTPHNADNHAKSLKKKEVKKITRAEFLAKSKSKKTNPSVDDRIKAIEEMTDVSAIEKAIEKEKSEKVLEVAYNKIEELKQD